MDMCTHVRIAIQLQHILEKKFPVKLNTIGLVIGAIKPDISWQFSGIPHCKKDGEDFVRKEINNLLTVRLERDSLCSYAFSERLGIITHFLSDFFCYAHTEKFHDTAWNHFVYEFQLFLQSIWHAEKINQRLTKSTIHLNDNSISICREIDELYTLYANSRQGAEFITDVEFALKACVSVCCSIVTVCIEQREMFRVDGEQAVA